MSLEKVIACLKRNKSFLITAHTNLEGDALGSEIAFYRLLKAMGKRATIINDDFIPYGYDFLSGIKRIKKFKQSQTDMKFDCFVILDCSGLKRCGEVSKINLDKKIIVNIDHHISNEKFGDINWIEPSASSCTEMIYKLYKKLHIAFDKDIAIALYLGMLTDTGSFRYTNTTSFTHQAVSELLKYNLDIPKVYKNVYENIPSSDMELLIKILPTIRYSASGKIVWFQLKRELLEKRKLSFDLSEHILSFGRAIKDVEAAVLFKENLRTKDEIRVNLRSQGKVDVNKIAQFFGGGGHRAASGATIRGKIDQVRKKVLAKIRENLK